MANRNTRETKRLNTQLGGRGCTVTFNYGGHLRTLVARNRGEALDEAGRRRGPLWDGLPVFSTALSIYRDVTGETRRRHTTQGFRKGMGS
jgi:hypothetical protein